MKLNLAAMLLGLTTAMSALAAPPSHWDYTGEAGPTHWGELESGFAACKIGHAQSPIDIRGAKPAKLAPIGFDYHASPAEVVNNGHTVQVNPQDGGAIHLESSDYQLVQLHFHTPSEENIAGKRFPLVAHLVHKNDAGELAVVAVLFKEGHENAALKQVFADLPAHSGEQHAVDGAIDIAAALPASHTYYAFTGSLTTPPCSEGVRWQVLKQPVELSKEQLAAFRKLYPMNARPVQPLHGRIVKVGG